MALSMPLLARRLPSAIPLKSASRPPASRSARSAHWDRASFTLVELLVGAVMLIMILSSLLVAFQGQAVLNEHHRNRSWAVNDASRVMERIRRLNIGCATPTVAQPAECGGACASWDAWVAAAAGGGGKSFQPNPGNERVVVSNPNPGGDPLQVTVAACWRHRNRTIGECSFAGGVLTAADGANGYAFNGIIESPAMLSTVMTCRP